MTKASSSSQVAKAIFGTAGESKDMVRVFKRLVKDNITFAGVPQAMNIVLNTPKMAYLGLIEGSSRLNKTPMNFLRPCFHPSF